MYLNLLILCVILPQRIIGNFADQTIRTSNNLLLRQKRVISRIPGEDRKVALEQAPFIVHLKHMNRISCVGSILSHHVVITIASCVPYDRSQYNIVSNSAYTFRGTSHNVTDINKQYGGHPERPLDGIALLTVFPPFAYTGRVVNIQLHSEPLLPGTLGTVFGWGFCNTTSNNHGTEFRKILRSIQVPIIAHRDCVNRYRHHTIMISDKDVCTFHPQRHCGHIDGGAPLVVDGELAGVHLWTGPAMNQIDPEYPDVFAMLQHQENINWIRTMINHIESRHNH